MHHFVDFSGRQKIDFRRSLQILANKIIIDTKRKVYIKNGCANSKV